MIFIDRSIPKRVADALKLVRDDVSWLEDHFAHNTPDSTWLAAAGRNGWLVITRDKRIRYRVGERGAIMRNGVGCFIISQKQDLNRWAYMKLLARSIDEMDRIFQSESRPFIYAVRADASLQRVA